MAAVKDAHRIVIKIGSALLVESSSGHLKTTWLASLAADVAALSKKGAQVVLVSSGSIALGRGVLRLPMAELSLEQSQAAAAVGQIRLARAYEEALEPLGIVTAQVLLTLEDSTDRRRYLNSRATLEQLLSLGVVPIVNENDTVATDEIRYGDNDRLAAQIAVTIGADHLVLLSDVDGFYTANPTLDANAQRYDIIDEITAELEGMAGDAGTGLSKGGMKTKLMAAKTATSAGCAMTIAKGDVLNPLSALQNGAASTLFTASIQPKTARKLWIGAMKTQGIIRVDAGAAKALCLGKSLLPAGIIGVFGTFKRGDPVEIQGPDNAPLGVGLIRYASNETKALKGKRLDQIEPLLGYPSRGALIHRDDMTL